MRLFFELADLQLVKPEEDSEVRDCFYCKGPHLILEDLKRAEHVGFLQQQSG